MNFTKKNTENNLIYLNKNLDNPFYIKRNTSNAINFLHHRMHEDDDINEDNTQLVFRSLLKKILRNLKRIKPCHLHIQYLRYLDYLIQFDGFNIFLFEILENYFTSNLKEYSHLITFIFGKILNKKMIKNQTLTEFTLNDFKTQKEEHITKYTKFFTTYFTYVEVPYKTNAPGKQYIVVKYLKYLDNIITEQEKYDILRLFEKLLKNTPNLIAFLKYGGYETLINFNATSYRLKSEIRSLRYIITKYNSFETSSLHQLCKYSNTINEIKFLIYHSNFDYNIKDQTKRTPFKYAIQQVNKNAIEFFISSGVEFRMKDLEKKMYKINSHDPLFLNVIQKAFIKRNYNEKIIKTVIASFGFYDVINDIIYEYIDKVTEYIKNEDEINKICDRNKLTNIATSTHITRLLHK